MKNNDKKGGKLLSYKTALSLSLSTTTTTSSFRMNQIFMNSFFAFYFDSLIRKIAQNRAVACVILTPDARDQSREQKEFWFNGSSNFDCPQILKKRNNAFTASFSSCSASGSSLRSRFMK
jgi:hypothetical protein